MEARPVPQGRGVALMNASRPQMSQMTLMETNGIGDICVIGGSGSRVVEAV